MDAVRYWVGLALVSLGVGVPLYWFSIHPFIGFWRRLGAVPTLAVHSVALLALAAAVIWQREAVMVGDLGTSSITMGAAAVVLALSIVLRLRQSRDFGTRVLAGLPELDPERYHSRLVTTDLHARIRHPRYVQLFLAFLAHALFVNYVMAYVLVAVSAVVLQVLVRLEERELIDRFGDEYRDYMTRVPRFVPRRTRR